MWLDGGHNVDGGRVLAEALAELEDRNPRPLLVVAGMLSTKDPDGFLLNFTGLAREVHAVPIAGNASAQAPADVAEAARHAGLLGSAHDSIEDALAAISSAAYATPPRIVITGSLYLAGEILAMDGTDPR